MNTNNIKSVFTEYIKLDKTQYAILINGAWGSGKTYFWMHDLKGISEENDFKPLYISLNGISKIGDLEHLLFIKLLPFLGNHESRTLKNTIALFTNALNQTSKLFLKSSLSEIFKGVSVDSLNFSKYVICFDDLERCQIPVEEILGFINNYVEHKNLKTIILADEKKIEPNQPGYENIKEKVIGRVVNFHMDIKETLPYLFKKYETNNRSFYKFLTENEKLLVEILQEYRQDNLRIISFYLEVLEKLFPVLKTVDENFIQEIILFTAIISIEFKIGNLKSSDHKDLKSLDSINAQYYFLNMAKTVSENQKNIEKKEERIKSYAEIFYNKYLHNRINNYFFYKSIYSYILSGFIDLKNLKHEIEGRYPEIISPEVNSFRALLHYKFRELTDSEFKVLTEEVLKYAREGKYSIYDYVQIAIFFYFFSNNKLILNTIEEIDDALNKGLKISGSRNEIDEKVFSNLMRFIEENPEVRRIKDLVRSIHIEIKKGKYIAEANELIKCLLADDEYGLSKIFEGKKYSPELFQYCNSKSFFETLTKVSNKSIFNFTELINERYNASNIGEFLFEDYNFLLSLQKKIEEFTIRLEDLVQPRKYLFLSLNESLKKVCDHLEINKENTKNNA